MEKRLTGAGSPFQLEERVEGDVTIRVFTRAPVILSDIFEKARSFGQRSFVVAGSRRLTYEDAFQQGAAFSRGLRTLFGITKGSRVALLLDNDLEWPIAFVALAALGAVPVALNSRGSVAAMSEALDITDCALIVASHECASALLEQGERRPVVCAGPGAATRQAAGWRTFDEVVAAGATVPDVAVEKPSAQDTAFIAFTSGTSGRAKAVVFTHRSVASGLMNMLLGGALISSRSKARSPATPAQPPGSPIPSALVVSPFSHIGGYAQLLLMPFIGGKIVLIPAWRPDLVLTLIEQEKIRSLSGPTPAMIREILALGRGKRDLSSLSSFNIHGAAVQANLVEEIIATFPHASVWTGYGMTETNGSVCVASHVDLAERPTTCGRPLPSVELRIVDEDGAAVPSGSVGQVRVRGAMLMQGYCRSPQATAEVLREGWLRTGDLGRVDAGGFLHIIDRAGDVVVTRAGEVSYTEIERALASHPLVEEAAVTGFGNFPSGARVMVAIVPRQNTTLTAAGLGAYLEQKIPLIRDVDAGIVLCTDLPRNASGKINRLELRRRLGAA